MRESRVNHKKFNDNEEPCWWTSTSSLPCSRVYDLIGRKGIRADATWPAPGEHIHTDGVGYRLRKGEHDITDFDWKLYLDFAAERIH